MSSGALTLELRLAPCSEQRLSRVGFHRGRAWGDDLGHVPRRPIRRTRHDQGLDNLMITSGSCPHPHLPPRVTAAQRPPSATLPRPWSVLYLSSANSRAINGVDLLSDFGYTARSSFPA